MPALTAGLAFHPEDPSLLAGGAFNGDVLLWNLAASEDKLVGKSSLCNYTHHEPVQRVCWTRDTQGGGGHRGYLLCSIAADGKVLMWNLGAQRGLPARGYLLPMPSASKAKQHASQAQGEGMHAGGCALCFSKERPPRGRERLVCLRATPPHPPARRLQGPRPLPRHHERRPSSTEARRGLTRPPRRAPTDEPFLPVSRARCLLSGGSPLISPDLP
jgi:hypothetical protein